MATQVVDADRGDAHARLAAPHEAPGERRRNGAVAAPPAGKRLDRHLNRERPAHVSGEHPARTAGVDHVHLCGAAAGQPLPEREAEPATARPRRDRLGDRRRGERTALPTAEPRMGPRATRRLPRCEHPVLFTSSKAGARRRPAAANSTAAPGASSRSACRLLPPQARRPSRARRGTALSARPDLRAGRDPRQRGRAHAARRRGACRSPTPSPGSPSGPPPPGQAAA